MVFTHKKAVKAELSRCTRAAVLWEGLLSWCCKETVTMVTIHEAPPASHEHTCYGDVAGIISRGEFSGGSRVTTHIPAPLGEARESDSRWLPGSGALGGNGK